ncbi:MAG: cAMP/cGMP-dependent 3',5'-cyclic-AMP/GMP phosphodiesterase [Leptospiraceae bacterium]|nr:cAMP/cGMP-dependent 3',5'-cyclic-AMP/GMP phosphodiesterase [Leptospiraceae bacterium]MCP5496269.1 cAMP/cGMP-dependent 3',5'-cyclic-AMP/GMP phosphodiesterase [Leptospiraceae bacterium]
MTEQKTPLVFILPNKFFHNEKGISTAELEFPIYYNFFFRQKKTFIICTKEQREQLIIVLKESLIGPDEINLADEYMNGENTPGFPKMKEEMAFFKGYSSLEDVVEFLIFQDNIVKFGKVVIKKLETGDFLVIDGDDSTNIPGEVGFNIKYGISQRLSKPYEAPLLGVTCLGPSHGFDPNNNTSGFIIWINHQGIMVDPPVNSTEWLRESNVNPKLINNVILTHCHADHDAGTFQKIMEENKITIYATPTVMESFLRKYCSLTKIPKEELIEFFKFSRITIGKPTIINGAEFVFHYSLHSIPSVGFEFFFMDQSFVYTSDHLNDKETHDKMYQKGILSESRWKFLKEFPSWDRNIIYHEAGVPPLHTKVSYLASLPEEIQKKIVVYHIAEKDMPKDTHLTLAKFGIENTVVPKITPPTYEGAYRLLDILTKIDIFQDLPIERAKEFLLIAKEKFYKQDELIFQKGTLGEEFFIIASGVVKFEGLNNKGLVKRYGTYEYFGEVALISDKPRAADVYAETDVVALTIEKTKFLQFIRNTKLRDNLVQLNRIRDTNSWQTITESKSLRGLTSHQITQLELIMGFKMIRNKEEVLIKEGKHFEHAYIVSDGVVEVKKDDKLVKTLTNGDFVGEIYRLTKHLASNYTFIGIPKTELYQLTQRDLIEYVQNNPGVYMRMNTVFS